MSFWKRGIDRILKSLTELREWWKQPSRSELMVYHMMENQTDQTRALVETVQTLAEAQTKQAEAFQRQLQSILDVWNQPIPDREFPIRSMRESELLRDLGREANAGDPLANEYLKPENQAQLEEYLALFRES